MEITVTDVISTDSVELPIWISELELTEKIQDVVPPLRNDNSVYRGVRLLVRVQHWPVGYVELVPSQFKAATVADIVWNRLGVEINKRLADNDLPTVTSLSVDGIRLENSSHADVERPLISVVVCTRDRPEGAATTVHGLVAMDYSPFEVIVVDNAPSTDSTKIMVEEQFGSDERVRYVREPRPGLSCARNRGVKEAKGHIVAFTDDDVKVDRWWLRGIEAGFRRAKEVGTVTGLIPTAELENEMQLYFDQRVTWGSSCEPRIFDLVDHRDDSVLYPYSPGIFGTGANFALRRDVIVELGGFDEALGAGAPPGGGEDLDIFVRSLLAGHSLVYEPSAIISHVHRVELEELRKQMFTYGSGFSAFMVKLMLLNNRTRVDLIKRIVPGVLRMRRINQRTEGNDVLPPGLIRHELKGMLYGPIAYFKGRVRARKL